MVKQKSNVYVVYDDDDDDDDSVVHAVNSSNMCLYNVSDLARAGL